MINFIRKYFNRKFNKRIMYVLPTKITNGGIIYKLIIQDENLKEYRITLKKYEFTRLYAIILGIILLEDISTIYYDCWDNVGLIEEFYSKLYWVELKKWRSNNQIENDIIKDNITDIQIN